MGDPAPEPKGQPGVAAAALFGLCPRCHARTLFDGAARFAPRCSRCGLDTMQFNVGDGPAAFLTMIVGVVVLGLALWTEFTFGPPWWLHVLLWVPVTFGLVLAGLRFAKAALLQAEFARKAREAGSGDLGGKGE